MNQLEQMLTRHEGKRSKIYRDSLGILSAGIGRNMEGVGLFPDEIQLMLENDIKRARTDLVAAFTWFPKLDEVRQAALIDMCFAGIGTLLGFKNMISAFAAKDYESAAAELMNSRYATQVGSRAKELAQMIKTGEWQTGY